MSDIAPWRRSAVAALLHAACVESTSECLELVEHVLDRSAIDVVNREFADVRPARGMRVDEHMPSAARRRAGAFFTPPEHATRLAELALASKPDGPVVDLSCGDGALLEACEGDVELVGVEREVVFALAAAWRLREHRAAIIWGDGLELHDRVRGAGAVVGNPPYVGEKGHRELFADVRARHPDLEQYFGPRIDLHYLFIHRALDALAPGGRLAYLTSEYWLTATGADLLRADLAGRTTDRTFERLGAGAFASAPGQHSLVFAATRRAHDVPGDGSTWHPFATTPRDTTGLPLGGLAVDRQGFVSGADRTTPRLAKSYGVEPDLPVFVWRADEVPEDDRDLFVSLVRRSDCAPNLVMIDPPENDFVLWRDGTEDAVRTARIERYLSPYRPLLERRREVQRGTMSWSRIWWPRRTVEYRRPKLVVPRRAKSPRVCLDLSGSHVSSDCTFLLAPDDVEDEVGWLVRLMLAANSPAAADQLRAFGKTKGDIMEFYAAPLRDWRLPVERVGDHLHLRDDNLERHARAIVDRLR